MVASYTAGHVSFYSDILSISRHTCLQIHRGTAWMVSGLLVLHVVLISTIQRGLSLDRTSNVFALTGGGCVVGLAVFALPYIHRHIFEVFLRTHQVLAYILLYVTWRHVGSVNRLSRICIITTFVLLSIALLLQLGFLIYRNKVFSLHGWPRARVSCNRPKIEGKDDSDVIIQVRVALTRPARIEAGQYINLWMPSVTWWSWAQVHPFMVTSWSHSAQEALDILIQPRHGFSRELLKHARAAPQGSASLRALIIGPHGMSENVDRYESVVLVASGFGIAAAIPYLKKLVYSYNTSASRTRRVHLVWEVETLDIAIAVQATLNSLLEDDILKKRYILTISIYVKSGQIIGDVMKFGNHDRAVVYNRRADYDQILQAEISGELIERLPNTQEEKGESLVMVAASCQVRDQIRLVLRDFVHQKAKMATLEFQP
ncbi:hypothetical protein EYB26_010050 [Talaromyces marneffei]|nr:uncharacterized protein EYB26_010050 [Talaromyces marneffei]QGA22334.1 hypothetical protein EYB26_010050 [Talaromyces marneffei]